jgi:hypothetical protein
MPICPGRLSQTQPEPARSALSWVRRPDEIFHLSNKFLDFFAEFINKESEFLVSMLVDIFWRATIIV